MTNFWKFTKIPNMVDFSFNNVLERFYDSGISGLVRENIQNSLDGKMKNNNDPVIVTIKTGEMDSSDVPGIEELRNHVESLTGKNEYTKNTIDEMKKQMIKNTSSYISFEDTNTMGLSGSKNGQSDDLMDSYSAYAYNIGVHFEDDDVDFEKSRGGSHGIGKIASNAASDIYMMFFANCDGDGNKHLGGTIQLIEHRLKEVCYRSTGYFAKEENNKFKPFINDFSEEFKKESRGLKIVIPFLREKFCGEKKLLIAVCDNFFIAVLKGKLVVHVNDHIINADTIQEIIKNKEYYEQDVEKIKKVFTLLYLNTCFTGDSRDLTVLDRNKNEYYFDLFFTYDPNISKGRTAIVRTVGMKIEDKKISGNVNKPYNAIMIPKTSKEDQFLKSLENESHTELSATHFKDEASQKNGKNFINNISKEVAKVIDEYVRKNNPTDGVMDSKDILYSVENKFREQLKNSASNVNVGKGKGKKTVVKVSTSPRPKNGTKDSKMTNISGVKKKIVSIDGDTKREYFLVSPNLVRRAITSNKEIFRIDLTSEKQLKNIEKCNIHFKLIDGMGKELQGEFNLSDNYDQIVNEELEFKIENNSIMNVSIDERVIDLELSLSKEFNKTHKFVYYLEV